MSNTLSLPHFQQSAEGYCLSACVRMVLAHLGFNLSEETISQVLGAQEFGAPSFAIRRLSALDLQVAYQEWPMPQVLAALQSGNPIIAFVRTAFLDHWAEDVAHAVVIAGAAENQPFWIHDPIRSSGPLAVSWNGLLAAWAEFGYRGAMITLKAR